MNHTRQIRTLLPALAALFLTATLHAQVPALINYQGRVAVDGVNFDSATAGVPGKFRFTLVNADGATLYWQNSDDADGDGQPDAAVELPVTKGLYSVLLGDESLLNMLPIPAYVFAAPDLRLRVWFDDGVNASQLLTPDQRLAPAAYLADGAVKGATIADGAIVAAKIAPAAIDGTHVAAGSLDFNHLIVPAAPDAGQVLGFDGASLLWTAPGDVDGIWTVLDGNAYRSTGNVGIGTSSPVHRLAIDGGPAWTSSNWLGSIELANAAAIGWATNAAGQRFGMGHTNSGFCLFRTASDLGTVNSPPLYDFFISDAGSVGIGTISPLAKLHISHPTSVSHRIETSGEQNAWTLVEFRNANGGWNIGTSRDFNGDQFYIARQGAAPVFSIQPNGDAFVSRNLSVRTLTIRGGADLAEPFLMKEEELEKGSVVVIDDEHPGRLKRSQSAYDTCVAGIISGANGVNPGIALQQEGLLEGGQNVALSGRVYVQADASGGPIKPGDLLTTSDTPGHAMKVREHTRAQGAVIGKAMSSLDEGTGMVLVLVTLQ